MFFMHEIKLQVDFTKKKLLGGGVTIFVGGGGGWRSQGSKRKFYWSSLYTFRGLVTV